LPRFFISAATIADAEVPLVGSVMPCDCRHWSNEIARPAAVFGVLLPPHPPTASAATAANATAGALCLLILDPILLLPSVVASLIPLLHNRVTLSVIGGAV
jgi:hypothetical protein